MLARFKELTEVLLPAKAREAHWPIRFDHCFKRICLDAAYGDCWYHHCAKPAERNIPPAALARAVSAAESIYKDGRPILNSLNVLSLGYRGK